MAVRIRMQQFGRSHRHFYRIVAIDHRQPREGRALEILGTYDPHMKDKEERVRLKADRLKYWLGVGAKPSYNVERFLQKYLEKFEKIEADRANIDAIVAAQKAKAGGAEAAKEEPKPAPEAEAAAPAAEEQSAGE